MGGKSKRIPSPSTSTKKKKISPMIDFLAGSYSGILAVIVGHPFDTVSVRSFAFFFPFEHCSRQITNQVKVRMQTSNKRAVHVLSDLLTGRGIVRSIYKGVSGPLCAVPAGNAFTFGGYGIAKKVLCPHDDAPSLSILGICGAWAGFMQCFVVGPIELVRCRLQTDMSRKVKTGTVWERDPHFREIRSIYRNEGGIRGFFRGFNATVIRDVPGFMIQFYTYESLKRAFEVNESKIGLMTVGGIAGMIGWFATYPQDIVKTNIQLNRDMKSTSFWNTAIHMVKTNGMRSMFRGLAPCLLRAFPVNGVGFMAYEQASEWLRKYQK